MKNSGHLTLRNPENFGVQQPKDTSKMKYFKLCISQQKPIDLETVVTKNLNIKRCV